MTHLLLIHLGGAVGLVHSLKRHNIPWKVHALAWGMAAYIILASTGYGAEARFRLPMLPALCLYAGHGLALVINRKKAAPDDG